MIGDSTAGIDRSYSSPTSLMTLRIACGAALIVGLLWRLIGWDRPFWADEVFTGAIALQPRFAVFIQDCLNELSGPGYYGFAWLWAKAFGVGNFSLRLPSFVFSLAAPLLLLWKGHPDRIIRLVWAAAVAVLHICAVYSWEARSYSLLFLLSVIQVLTFERLVRHPGWRAAYGWAAVSVFAAFTHYFTLPMTGLQAAALIVLRWRQVRRYWPALLLFVPLAIWLHFHLAVLVRFSSMAWQPFLGRGVLLETVRLATGSGALLLGIVPFGLVMAATFAGDLYNWWSKRQPLPYDTADLAAIGAAVGALATIFVYGYLKHSFTPRYLMPIMPPLLLAPAIWARRVARSYPAVPAILATVFAAGGALLAARDAFRPPYDGRSNFEAQTASEALMKAGVRHAVFLWDAPEAKIPTESLVRRANGFFFDRAAPPVRMTSLILARRTDDPDANVVLPRVLDATRRSGERDGFVWMFVPGGGSAASRHPVRYGDLAKQFSCRRYGSPGLVTTLGCIRRASL